MRPLVVRGSALLQPAFRPWSRTTNTASCVALLGVALIACAAFVLGCNEQPSPCVNDGGKAKVKGTRMDYTTKPGDYAGYSLTGPAPCNARSEMVSVRGTGTRRLEYPVDAGCANEPESGVGGNGMTCPVANPWVFDYGVKSALRAASISVYDQTLCTGQGILIDDWTRSDETVAIVAQEVVKWELGDTYDVEIGPVTYWCY